MPSAMTSSRGAPSGGGCLTTNPPLAPVGTMTVFFTICALTRPRISVRRSSRRSDQRSPPRATAPKRRWMPMTRGGLGKIGHLGRVELEGQRRAGGGGHGVVGRPLGGDDGGEQRAEHPVGV